MECGFAPGNTKEESSIGAVNFEKFASLPKDTQNDIIRHYFEDLIKSGASSEKVAEEIKKLRLVGKNMKEALDRILGVGYCSQCKQRHQVKIAWDDKQSLLLNAVQNDLEGLTEIILRASKPKFSEVGIKTKETALQYAIVDSNLPIIEKFLKAGPKPTFKDLSYVDDLPTLKLLIKYGADIKSEGGNKNTLLHKLARPDVDADAYNFLISSGLNVNAQNNHAVTPLEQALANGATNKLGILLSNGASTSSIKQNAKYILGKLGFFNPSINALKFLLKYIDPSTDLSRMEDWAEAVLFALNLKNDNFAKFILDKGFVSKQEVIQRLNTETPYQIVVNKDEVLKRLDKISSKN